MPTAVVLVEDCGNGADDDGNGDVLTCGVTSVHEADNDPCDGDVDFDEIVGFLELWLLGGIDIEEAVEVIGLWRG